MKWYVYMVQCADGSLYTGITIDLKRRVWEHNNSSKGAKSVKGRRPVHLVHTEEFETQSEARKREYEIKRHKRVDKLALVDK